jgi:hypothetical protein
MEAKFFRFLFYINFCLFLGSLELIRYLVTTVSTEGPDFYLTCGHGALWVNNNRDTARVNQLELPLFLNINSRHPNTETRMRMEPADSIYKTSSIFVKVLIVGEVLVCLWSKCTVDVRTVIKKTGYCIHNINYVVFSVTQQETSCFEVIFSSRSQTFSGMHDNFHQSHG